MSDEPLKHRLDRIVHGTLLDSFSVTKIPTLQLIQNCLVRFELDFITGITIDPYNGKTFHPTHVFLTPSMTSTILREGFMGPELSYDVCFIGRRDRAHQHLREPGVPTWLARTRT